MTELAFQFKNKRHERNWTNDHDRAMRREKSERIKPLKVHQVRSLRSSGFSIRQIAKITELEIVDVKITLGIYGEPTI